MKLKLLFFAAFLALASCSGDDNANPGDSIDKDIKSITTIITSDVQGNYRFETEYEDNKPVVEYEYNNEGQLLSRCEFIYNLNGSLESKKYYVDDMYAGELALTYDDTDRLIKLSNSYSSESTGVTYDKTFVYNPDNTIISNTVVEFGAPDTAVFYLNDQGLIYKIAQTIGSNTYEEMVTYNNESIMHLRQTLYGNNYVTTYTYDYTTQVKGEYLNIGLNLFNGNKLNSRLLTGFYSAHSRDKYLLSSTSQSGDQKEYNYEFDTDGYPAKVKTYVNNDLYRESRITYQ